MRSAIVGVFAALAVAACSNDSGGGPTTPTGNAATITIVANNSSQSFTPNPAQAGG